MPHVDAALRTFSLPRLSCGFDGARDVLRLFVRRFHAWRERNRRAVEDVETLAHMSDRELLDIGLPRASVRAALQRAWLRDSLR